jgi:ubiquinone/menaquinone biosynthesis C-methylase UbiE
MFKSLGIQLSKPSGFLGKLVAKLMEKGNKKCYDKIIPQLDLKNGDKIFEIGYGHGLGLSLIAAAAKDCTISGIDYSDLMYKMATKRNKKFIDAGIMNLRYGDLLTVDTGNEKYNKIFCVNVIYFWSDLKKAFDKIFAMLEPGGIYCIFMEHEKDIERLKFTQNFNKYSIEKVESALKAAGFKSVEYKLEIGYFIKAKK